MIGKATKENRYLPSGTLRNGKLVQDYGEGLCQLAGIIYYLSLLAGLRIVERHSHTRDIYKEHERFAPLGSDVSVAYGTKDLRVRNSLSFLIQFRFNIESGHRLGHIYSEGLIPERKIDFVRHNDVNSTRTSRHPHRIDRFGKKTYCFIHIQDRRNLTSDYVQFSNTAIAEPFANFVRRFGHRQTVIFSFQPVEIYPH